jgi:uncharacterized protein DUF397
MEMTKAPAWRTSSYSGSGGGQCVEAGAVRDAILVRDTKDRGGPVLAFGQQAWRAFAARVKAVG